MANFILNPICIVIQLLLKLTLRVHRIAIRYILDIDLLRGVHPVERPARADRDTDRAERGRYFDTHEQVFPLDEHRGQGRYSAYTPNSNIDNE